MSLWEKVCGGEVAIQKKMIDNSPVVMLRAVAFIPGIKPNTIY